jgi:hypothetical protein
MQTICDLSQDVLNTLFTEYLQSEKQMFNFSFTEKETYRFNKNFGPNDPYRLARIYSRKYINDSFWEISKINDRYNVKIFYNPLMLLFMTGDKRLRKILHITRINFSCTNTLFNLVSKFTNLKELVLKERCSTAQLVFPLGLIKLDIIISINNIHKILGTDSAQNLTFPQTLEHFGLRTEPNHVLLTISQSNHIEKLLPKLPQTLESIDIPLLYKNFLEVSCQKISRFEIGIFGGNGNLFAEIPKRAIEFTGGEFAAIATTHVQNCVDLPKNLVSLSILTTFEMDLKTLQLMPLLVKLHIPKVVSFTKDAVSSLPQTLTDLAIRIFAKETTDFIKYFPRNLTSMRLDCNSKEPFENVDHLPKTLTSLHLAIKIYWQNVQNLPNLHVLKFYNRGSKPIERDFWKNIPRSITHIESSYQFSPKDIQNLPPNLRTLVFPEGKKTYFNSDECKKILPLLAI